MLTAPTQASCMRRRYIQDEADVMLLILYRLGFESDMYSPSQCLRGNAGVKQTIPMRTDFESERNDLQIYAHRFTRHGIFSTM